MMPPPTPPPPPPPPSLSPLLSFLSSLFSLSLPSKRNVLACQCRPLQKVNFSPVNARSNTQLRSNNSNSTCTPDNISTYILLSHLSALPLSLPAPLSLSLSAFHWSGSRRTDGRPRPRLPALPLTASPPEKGAYLNQPSTAFVT